MEKLSHTTESILDENVEKLAELFPEVVTEVREPDGSLRHTIDVDALRECVGDVAEGQRERYQFTWPGKREAKQEAYRQIDKCLRPCPEESVNWDTTGNLYIEGDNLDALKLLRNTYAGKVKMIYIDPPYNTGHDFIYDDDFARTKADYDAESGDYDEEGGRLVANPESNGRFHSDWCSMMYPRLLLARDLLSEDGAIFISIDDAEVGNLMDICQEVFGASNFVGNIIWQSRTSISNDDAISTNHNHTLIFSRERLSLQFGGDEIDSSEYKNPDGDVRGPWKPVPMDANHAGGNTQFPIVNPNTGKEFLPPNGRSWAYNSETVRQMLEEGRISFGSKGDSAPKRKMYLAERIERGDVKTPSSILLDAGTTKSGTETLMSYFGSKIFDYPKPASLLERLIRFGFPSGEGIILDFFSGSASTAEGAIQFNSTGNQVRFILVQLPETIDPLDKSRTIDARKTAERAAAVLDSLGKPRNICEIGKERIRRAGKKIAAEVEESNRQLKLGEEPKRVPDIGFRVLKIDSSNFEDVSAKPSEFSQDAVLKFADNLKLDRTPDDLIIQVMLKKQIELSAPIEKLDVDGCTVFSVDNGRLVACFDRDVPVEVMTTMAKMEPDYAVMRDASFTGDDAVSNFTEIFKNYSSITEVEVI